MHVHFFERTADDHDDEASLATQALTVHPRTPGTLWDAIGWTQQKDANLAADIERGAYQRKGWFGTSKPDRAA